MNLLLGVGVYLSLHHICRQIGNQEGSRLIWPQELQNAKLQRQIEIALRKKELHNTIVIIVNE